MTRQRLGIWLCFCSIQLAIIAFSIIRGVPIIPLFLSVPVVASFLCLSFGGILFIYPDPENRGRGHAT